jgi:hypothetical protein
MNTFTEQMQERCDALHRNRTVPPSREELHTLIADTITATLKEVERVVEGERKPVPIGIEKHPDANLGIGSYNQALDTIKAKIGALVGN